MSNMDLTFDENISKVLNIGQGLLQGQVNHKLPNLLFNKVIRGLNRDSYIYSIYKSVAIQIYKLAP